MCYLLASPADRERSAEFNSWVVADVRTLAIAVRIRCQLAESCGLRTEHMRVEGRK